MQLILCVVAPAVLLFLPVHAESSARAVALERTRTARLLRLRAPPPPLGAGGAPQPLGPLGARHAIRHQASAEDRHHRLTVSAARSINTVLLSVRGSMEAWKSVGYVTGQQTETR